VNIVADQNISAVIIQALRQDGHAVVAIRETARGSADDQILALAHAEGALIVTDDRDFGQLVFRQVKPTSGVLYIRLHGIPSSDRAQLILEVLREHGNELAGKFAVLTRRGLRIREPNDPPVLPPD
jgi:predicted nuclease of predicted toxin-antitoxin system